MTTAYTSLLGLALPVTGELSGTWGDTVNDSITSLLDTSVAGTTNVSADSNVTLTTTSGAANTARQAILLFSGARTAIRTVTAPAQSKIYTVINATTGGFAVQLVGAGPTTGVTIANGARTVVAWNGSDFVEVSSPSSIILPGGTANGVLYLNGSKVVTSGSALTFDGTTLKNSSSSSGATPSGNANQLVAESSGNAGLTIASGASSLGNIFFADSGDSADGYIQYDQSGRSLRFGTATSEKARLDSSGNLGLGVTPSAWDSTFVGFQLGASSTSNGNASIYSQKNGGFSAGLMTNAYYNGGWKYVASSNPATRYEQNTGASGYFAWYTAPSGTAGNAITFTQAMTLDASGRLGIGTTSPSEKLQLEGSGSQYMRVKTTTTNADMYFGITSSSVGYVGTGGSDPLGFYTAGTERARIDSSGNLLVGTTSLAGTGVTVYKSGAIKVIANGQTLANTVQNCYANSNADNTDLIEFNVGQYQRTCMFVRNSGAGAGNPCAHITFQYGAGTNAGYISSTGTTTSYTSASDYRLKENVQPMQNALAKVAQLNPVTFTWKDNGFDGQGFIAHELQAVVPDAVVGEKDAVNEDGSIKPQAIDTSFLVATLTAALQEAVAEINQLKARLDAANL
jgi:hypothetical protein